MTATDGTVRVEISKVPHFYYSNVGFTVIGTATVELCLLDIKGVTHLHCMLENDSASGAANRLDWGAIAYLDDADAPDADSAKTIIAADTAIATNAVGEFILGVNAHTVTTDQYAAPVIKDVLPAARLQINVDAQGAVDTITANLWINGVMQ
jgi:hypothetical protein